MRIYYIGVWRNEKGKDTMQLCADEFLKDFNYFSKKAVREILEWSAGVVAQRTSPGSRNSAPADEKEKEDETPRKPDKDVMWVHAYGRSEGVCGIAISDGEYDARICHSLINKFLDDFITKYPRTSYVNLPKTPNPTNPLPLPGLEDYIVKYQDPGQADPITKIQQELNDTKIVLHKTIEGVLERGEKVDNLVAKSEGLSASSKMFYTQAKKQNSCCIVM
ncbi:snare protein [Polyplosphaeria fusca]|uniref:Snare protein n=1 Tax=Polyplosphaeria fusca TaxID=682080 RepID=A0A9P4QVS4_9PLEO|nr:snare protein [Polyplosphaeria fusca]